MFKYENKMLPSSFNNYFTKLEKIHSHKVLVVTFTGSRFLSTEAGRKRLHHTCLIAWEGLSVDENLLFFVFNNKYKKEFCLVTHDFRYVYCSHWRSQKF